MIETDDIRAAIEKAEREGRVADTRKTALPSGEQPEWSEKEFQAVVIDIAKRQGWKVYHTYDSRKSAPGFPDLTMVRRGMVIFAELKVGKNKLEPEQEDWKALLIEAAERNPMLLYFVWRPSDMEMIGRILA